jgi:hypothetical protein
VRIESCTVKVLAHKPGSSTIFRYELHYGASHARRDAIVGKYNVSGKGMNAYQGMTALWRSPLANSDEVSIAEPLGYIDELRTVLQGVVPEECNLEDVLRRAVRSKDPSVWAELTEYARKTGAALAALHRSGVQHAARVTWEDMRANLAKHIERLGVVFPELMAGTNQLLARIETLQTVTPADPALPSHGAFRPEQVVLHQGRVGFIDFDRICMAEPARDIACFRVELATYGARPPLHTSADRTVMMEHIAHLDAVNEAFLTAYEASAPVSRKRVALWEVLYHCRALLLYWIKPRRDDRSAIVYMLEGHLRAMGLWRT